jgi:Activator of Hsp90 ATPase homolog 1-like protein
MSVGRFLAGAAALTLLAGSASARSTSDFPEVMDGSFTEADGSKVLRLSLVVPAERTAVWARFTTTEGYTAWATPMAKVDFGLNGLIEASYDANAKAGDADNIRNRIIAYTPHRMIALKNENAPAALPGRETFGEIVTVMEFEDAPGGTKVSITGVGYKPGEPYATLFKHFSWGNAYSLMELKTSFVKGPVDWKALAARQKAQAAAAKVQGVQP